MSMFFVRTTDKGIVVSNKKMASKEITLKGGKKRVMPMQMEGLKFGFFACEDPTDLGYVKGEELPVSLSTSNVVTEAGEILPNLFWCNPD